MGVAQAAIEYIAKNSSDRAGRVFVTVVIVPVADIEVGSLGGCYGPLADILAWRTGGQVQARNGTTKTASGQITAIARRTQGGVALRCVRVLRPAGSSFTSLRKAPHRPESGSVVGDCSKGRLCAEAARSRWHWGGCWSEVKEEPKRRGTRTQSSTPVPMAHSAPPQKCPLALHSSSPNQ